MSVQDTPQEFSETETAAAKLEEIEYRLNKWNGMASEVVKFGRTPLRKLIGWKESKEKGNEELFAKKLIETIVSLNKILHPNPEPKPEEPVKAPDNVVPITPSKPPHPDQVFSLIFTKWTMGKVSAKEVCGAVIDLAIRGDWNWRDPRGRMETQPDKAFSFFRGFCVPPNDEPDAEIPEMYFKDLSGSERRLFAFICESFMEWYTKQEKAGYPSFKNQK